MTRTVGTSQNSTRGSVAQLYQKRPGYPRVMTRKDGDTCCEIDCNHQCKYMRLWEKKIYIYIRIHVTFTKELSKRILNKQ